MRPRTSRLLAVVLCSVALVAGPAPVSAQPSSPAPSPIGTDRTGLPESFTTEVIEPGVVRIISDGHRALSRERTAADVFTTWGDFAESHEYRQVRAAPDGSIWILDADGLVRVGRRRAFDLKGQPPAGGSDDLGITADGTVWRMASKRFSFPNLRSSEGRGWRRHMPRERFCAFEVRPGGAVWATWMRPSGAGNEGCTMRSLGRWNGERWRVFDVPERWISYGNQLAATTGEEVWICCKGRDEGRQVDLLRFDGRRFRVVPDPAPRPERADAPPLLDGSPDGTLWLRRDSSTLARHDDVGWTVFTAADDAVPQMGWVPEGGGFLRAAPDGSVWVSTTTARTPPDDWPPVCDGLAHFDGSVWSRYLGGMCIFAIDVAPDGRAWVQAALADTGTSPEPVNGDPIEPIQTFVIDPAAG